MFPVGQPHRLSYLPIESENDQIFECLARILPVPSCDSQDRWVVIPAYDEHAVCALEHGLPRGKVLLVINEPIGRPSVRSAELAARYSERAEVEIVKLIGRQAIAKGVGEARSIGFARVMEKLTEGRAQTSWIRTTDADATLANDYWDAIDVRKNTAACLFPFVHVSPSKELAAHVEAYEASLRYYVLGLAYAGSPYSFHTVGSTLAIDSKAYRQVHGFPKRQAGEDFYLLNKLAKVGAIERLNREPVVLSGRASHRVPFGTGPSVAASLSRGEDPWTRSTYHPSAFEALRILLSSFAHLLEYRETAIARIELALLRALRGVRGLDSAAGVAVERLRHDGTIAALARAARERNQGHDRLRAIHTHFDAFRTLKLIHALRDECLGTVPLREALTMHPFKCSLPKQVDRINRWLRELEEERLPIRTGLAAVGGEQNY